MSIAKRSKLPSHDLLDGTFYYNPILGALAWQSDDLTLIPPKEIIETHGDRPRIPMTMGLPSSSGKDREFYVHDVILKLAGADLPDSCQVIYRDGDQWNTNLMNLRVVLPGVDHDFGFLSSIRKEGHAVFLGVFPTTTNKFSTLEFRTGPMDDCRGEYWNTNPED